MSKQKKGLGRGLSALLGEIEQEMATDVPVNTSESPEKESKYNAQEQDSTSYKTSDNSFQPLTHAGSDGDRIIMVSLSDIVPSSFQPRQEFADDAIEDLVNSIKEKGILQPILVRKDKNNAGKFEIIAGERRWRAATKAGIKQIPVLIKDFTDKQTLEVALIENLQRENLSPLEEAVAYQRLSDTFGHRQEDIAKAVGKSRSYITNTLRLLNLPDEVKVLLSEGKITAGHARTLLNTENPLERANEIIEKGLTVREAETLKKPTKEKQKKKKSAKRSSDVEMLEYELQNTLNLPVHINVDENKGKGSVVINFNSFAQLDALVEFLMAGSRV